ncbi:hypothetical protein SAZ11_07535 [Streptomyces sp. FXJ1.4098]|nr:hypothetical protein [Streptomyces sp. FXJ1.4098]
MARRHPETGCPEYDSKNSSWQQVQGYRMPTELVAVFRTADEKMEELKLKALIGGVS